MLLSSILLLQILSVYIYIYLYIFYNSQNNFWTKQIIMTLKQYVFYISFLIQTPVT